MGERDRQLIGRKEGRRKFKRKSPEPNQGDHARSLFIGRGNNSAAGGAAKWATFCYIWCRLVGSGVLNELN
jgi:hypothetical protein